MVEIDKENYIVFDVDTHGKTVLQEPILISNNEMFKWIAAAFSATYYQHTLNTLAAHSHHTRSTLSKRSLLTLLAPSTHYEHAVNGSAAALSYFLVWTTLEGR